MHCGCTSLPILLECLPDAWVPLGPHTPVGNQDGCPLCGRGSARSSSALWCHCAAAGRWWPSQHTRRMRKPPFWGFHPPRLTKFLEVPCQLGLSHCHRLYAALSHSPQRGQGSVPLHGKLHRPLRLSFCGPMSQESCLFSLI